MPLTMFVVLSQVFFSVCDLKKALWQKNGLILTHCSSCTSTLGQEDKAAEAWSSSSFHLHSKEVESTQCSLPLIFLLLFALSRIWQEKGVTYSEQNFPTHGSSDNPHRCARSPSRACKVDNTDHHTYFPDDKEIKLPWEFVCSCTFLMNQEKVRDDSHQSHRIKVQSKSFSDNWLEK